MSDQTRQHHAHKPPDRGWAAWRVVFASFIYEGLQWGASFVVAISRTERTLTKHVTGFPLSFGVFQNYFLANNTFTDTKLIPTIGVLSTSILYLGSPAMSLVVEQYPQHRVLYIWIGWLLQIVALVGASFCNTVPQLVLVQGFLYSTGDLIVYMPMMSLINEWFEEKRGLAYGLVDASTGLTGIGFPFVLQAALDRFGWRTTLRAFAVFFFVLTLPVLPLLHARVPLHGHSRRPFSMRHYWTLFTQPRFHAYSWSNVFQGLGFFMPELFLPTYASSLGYGQTIGALMIALLSASQFLGQVVFGYLSDRKKSEGRDGSLLSIHTLMFVSSFVAGVAVLTLWGLAKSLAPLVLFALVYGFFASAFVVLYARMGTALTEDSTAVLASYGMFSAQKGLGNILEGPLSSALWQTRTTSAGFGLGAYSGLIWFTGSCFIASALVIPLYHACHTVKKRQPVAPASGTRPPYMSTVDSNQA